MRSIASFYLEKAAFPFYRTEPAMSFGRIGFSSEMPREPRKTASASASFFSSEV